MKPALLAERLAFFLGVLAILLRWTIGGSVAGTGTNLLIHALFWVALGLWFAAGALRGGASYRFTGAEFALLAFSIACLLSAQRASYRLPALEQAMAMLSFAFLAVLSVNALGRATLHSLLLPTTLAFGLYALWQYFVIYPEALKGTGDPALSEEMRRRLGSREVFATFIGPNQFAGFLVLLLPLLAGGLADARGGGPRALAPRILALATGSAALFLTGSTGAWVALAAGAAAFAGLALTRERGRTALVATGAAASAVVAALLLFGPLLDLASRNFSMHVRAVYWRAARRIVPEAPILGVGLDNFQEHFFRFKSDVPQEATRAHNDYFQILVDAGILGLLAFAALLGWGLRRAFVRKETPPAPIRAPPGLVPAAAALALLWAWLQNAHLGIFGVVWGACYAFSSKRDRQAAEGPLPWTRIGAAAGLVALLVHMAVDFDLYEFGLGMSLFLGLAFAAMLQGAATEVRLPKGVCAAAAAALLLPAGALLAWTIPSALAADAELRAAEAEDDPRNVAALALAAQAHNPFEPEAFRLQAEAEFQRWTAISRSGPRAELAPIEMTITGALESVCRLRPHFSAAWALLADRERRFHAFHGAANPAMAEAHLRQALAHQRRALELYPTRSLHAYALGRLLDLAGRGDEALSHYRESLRLSERAAAEPWATDRLPLTPLARARGLLRLGRADEALRTLEKGLRSRRVPREELEDERDGLTGPVIDAATKAIMAPP